MWTVVSRFAGGFSLSFDQKVSFCGFLAFSVISQTMSERAGKLCHGLGVRVIFYLFIFCNSFLIAVVVVVVVFVNKLSSRLALKMFLFLIHFKCITLKTTPMLPYAGEKKNYSIYIKKIILKHNQFLR